MGRYAARQHPLSPFLHLLANVLAHSFATLTPNKSMNHIFSGRNYILDNCLNTPICHTRPWLQHLNKVETIRFKDCFPNSSHSGQRTSHVKGQCLSCKCWRNLNFPMAHIHNYPIGISNNDCKSCGPIIWWVVGAITVEFPTPVGRTFPFVVITIPLLNGLGYPVVHKPQPNATPSMVLDRHWRRSSTHSFASKRPSRFSQ